MGGGNDNTALSAAIAAGLSPRGRGKQAGCGVTVGVAGSIPAWAGETSKSPTPNRGSGVYPRVGGGNHAAPGCYVLSNGLSPRGRGKLVRKKTCGEKSGSIPAWAGETHGSGASGVSRTVYPRVGGGNIEWVRRSLMSSGLSPRGRGKR